MKTLTSLSNEMILQIAGYLPNSSLSTLSLTSKWFSRLLVTYLYKRATVQESKEQDHPLIWAVKRGNMSALKKLLSYHKTPMATVSMRIAVKLGNEEALEVFISEGVVPSSAEYLSDEEKLEENMLRDEPLLLATDSGYFSIVKRLLGNSPHLMKSTADPTKYTEKELLLLLCAFKCALCKGKLDIAEFIYYETALTMPEESGPMLFYHAVVANSRRAVEFLYHKRHEINSMVYPFEEPEGDLDFQCILCHDHEYTDCLWQAGPILHIIAERYNQEGTEYPTVEMAKLVLDLGADPEDECGHESTALHIAAEMEDVPLAKYLLDRGAEIDPVDQYGKSALIIATEMQNHPLVRLLLQYGADVNIADTESKTALHFATEIPDVELMQMLILSRANIHAIDGDGDTVLHIAAAVEDPGPAWLLLRCGATVHTVNNDGETALDIARDLGHRATLRLFEFHLNRLHSMNRR